METKRCPRCKKTLSVDKFAQNRRRKDGLQSRCKKCDCEYKAEKYQENKELFKSRAKKRRRENRQWFITYKQSLKCSKCGDERWYVLDFHHRKNSKKNLNICEMVNRVYSKEKIVEEIEKCDVLCANCHREEHYLRQ